MILPLVFVAKSECDFRLEKGWPDLTASLDPGTVGADYRSPIGDQAKRPARAACRGLFF
jgi:hypothetical protein